MGNISSMVSGTSLVELEVVVGGGVGVGVGVALLGKESNESRIGEEEGIIGGRGGVVTTTWFSFVVCVG